VTPRPRRTAAPVAGRAALATTAMEEAGVPLFAASMLEPGEIIVATFRPSLLWIALRSARGVLLALAAAALGAAASGWAGLGWETPIAQLGIAVAAARTAAGGAEWASRVYVLTDRRVLRRRGVLAPTVYSANLNALRRVELEQDRVDRLLRTGTVTFSTRTEGRWEAAWVMVPRAREVHELVEATRRRYGR
jgi:hypothetical protein